MRDMRWLEDVPEFDLPRWLAREVSKEMKAFDVLLRFLATSSLHASTVCSVCAPLLPELCAAAHDMLQARTKQAALVSAYVEDERSRYLRLEEQMQMASLENRELRCKIEELSALQQPKHCHAVLETDDSVLPEAGCVSPSPFAANVSVIEPSGMWEGGVEIISSSSSSSSSRRCSENVPRHPETQGECGASLLTQPGPCYQDQDPSSHRASSRKEAEPSPEPLTIGRITTIRDNQPALAAWELTLERAEESSGDPGTSAEAFSELSPREDFLRNLLVGSGADLNEASNLLMRQGSENKLQSPRNTKPTGDCDSSNLEESEESSWFDDSLEQSCEAGMVGLEGTVTFASMIESTITVPSNPITQASARSATVECSATACFEDLDGDLITVMPDNEMGCLEKTASHFSKAAAQQLPSTKDELFPKDATYHIPPVGDSSAVQCVGQTINDSSAPTQLSFNSPTSYVNIHIDRKSTFSQMDIDMLGRSNQMNINSQRCPGQQDIDSRRSPSHPNVNDCKSPVQADVDKRRSLDQTGIDTHRTPVQTVIDVQRSPGPTDANGQRGSDQTHADSYNRTDMTSQRISDQTSLENQGSLDGQSSPGHTDTNGQSSPGHTDTNRQSSPGHTDANGQSSPSHTDIDAERSAGCTDIHGPKSPGHSDVDGQSSPGQTDISAERSSAHTDIVTHSSPGRADINADSNASRTDIHAERSPGHTDVDGQRSPSNMDTHAERSTGHTDIDGQRTPSHTDIDGQRSASHTDVDGQRSAGHTDIRAERSAGDPDVDAQRSPSHTDIHAERIAGHPVVDGQRSPGHTDVDGKSRLEQKRIKSHKIPNQKSSSVNIMGGLRRSPTHLTSVQHSPESLAETKIWQDNLDLQPSHGNSCGEGKRESWAPISSASSDTVIAFAELGHILLLVSC